MKLDHIALNVANLDRSCEFYMSFGAKKTSKPSTKFAEVILGDARIHLVQEDYSQAKNICGLDHFCLEVKSFEDLKKLRDQANTNPLISHLGPFEIEESPPMGTDGKGHVEERPPRYVLYLKDPDAVMIEIRLYNN